MTGLGEAFGAKKEPTTFDAGFGFSSNDLIASSACFTASNASASTSAWALLASTRALDFPVSGEGGSLLTLSFLSIFVLVSLTGSREYAIGDGVVGSGISTFLEIFLAIGSMIPLSDDAEFVSSTFFAASPAIDSR